MLPPFLNWTMCTPDFKKLPKEIVPKDKFKHLLTFVEKMTVIKEETGHGKNILGYCILPANRISYNFCRTFKHHISLCSFTKMLESNK